MKVIAELKNSPGLNNTNKGSDSCVSIAICFVLRLLC